MNNNTVLTISGGSIANAGKLTMNSSGNFTELILSAPNTILTGGGTLTMSNKCQ